jgi:hypothetical protein
MVGLALFVLVQVVLAVAALPLLPLRDPDHAHKMQLLRRRLARGRPLCVVQIGSSRTVYGLRGQVAEPWLEQRLGQPVVLFNLGSHACGPMLNRLNLERLFNSGVRPDLVLVEVLPPLLTEQPRISELLPERVAASRLRHEEMQLLARLARPERPALSREWWACQVAPWSAHRFSILTAAAPNLLPPQARTNNYAAADASGWIGMPRQCREVEQRALARAEIEYRAGLQVFRLSPRILAGVRETVQRCDQAGVKAALVLMPEGPIFRSWYPAAAWRQIDTALKELSRECGVPLLDLRECAGEADFLDSHHLYPEGATVYTRRLAERLVPLLHQGEPSPSSRQEVRLR